MKIGIVVCVAVASAALGVVAAWPLQDAHAKDSHAKAGADQAPKASPEMEKFLAAGKPGPEHKLLEAMSGTWTTELNFNAGPGQPPIKNTGTDEFSMFMDNRFQMDKHSSNGPAGSITGMGISGFNNATGMFEGVWLDSTSTQIMHSTGTYDPASDAITYKGDYKDAVTGKQTSYRQIIHKVNADEYAFQMFTQTADAPEVLSMSVKYTRQK